MNLYEPLANVASSDVLSTTPQHRTPPHARAANLHDDR